MCTKMPLAFFSSLLSDVLLLLFPILHHSELPNPHIMGVCIKSATTIYTLKNIVRLFHQFHYIISRYTFSFPISLCSLEYLRLLRSKNVFGVRVSLRMYMQSGLLCMCVSILMVKLQQSINLGMVPSLSHTYHSIGMKTRARRGGCHGIIPTSSVYCKINPRVISVGSKCLCVIHIVRFGSVCDTKFPFLSLEFIH